MQVVGTTPVRRKLRRRVDAKQRGALPSLPEILGWSVDESCERFDVLAAVYEYLPPWQREIVDACRSVERARVDDVKFAPAPPAPVEHERICRVRVRTMDREKKLAYWREAQRRKREKRVS